jgi:hypothetical protein
MASDFSVTWQCLSKRTIGFSLRIKLHTLIRVSPPSSDEKTVYMRHEFCVVRMNLRRKAQIEAVLIVSFKQIFIVQQKNHVNRP